MVNHELLQRRIRFVSYAVIVTCITLLGLRIPESSRGQPGSPHMHLQVRSLPLCRQLKYQYPLNTPWLLSNIHCSGLSVKCGVDNNLASRVFKQPFDLGVQHFFAPPTTRTLDAST